MGVKTAPSYFQYVMTTLFCDMNSFLFIFIDDMIIVANSMTEMKQRLLEVFKRLQKHRIRLNPNKCLFAVPEVEYLGFKVNAQGLAISPARTDAILQMKPPTTITGLRSFLGTINFFRDFVPNFAMRTKPLFALTSGKTLQWNGDMQRLFDSLKKDVAAAPLLHHANYSEPLYLATDASTVGVGGTLFQCLDKNNPENRSIICYMSKAFSPTEQKWSTIEQESYAIYFCITHLRSYLLGHSFTVLTDHRNLTYLSRAEAPKIVRWRLALQQYDFNVVHIPGSSNTIPDALSRCFRLNLKEQGFEIPADHIRAMLKVHNRLVGHVGIEATVSRLRESGHDWPHMIDEVKSFISACPNCQKVRLRQPPQQLVKHSTMVYEPFSVVIIDTIGPLPCDKYDNKYIITIMDAFTRFTLLYPAEDATAMSAAAALLQFFGLFGFPYTLRSDQGTQFLANIIKDFCALAGITNEVSIAYHHQPIVERDNQEIMRHLRAMIFDIQVYDNWSTYLPLVQRIINASVSSVTGYSPAEMVFGPIVNIDRSLLPAAPWGGGSPPSDASDYVKDLLAKQKLILESAAKHQKEKADIRLNDQPTNPVSYPVGSLVLVKYPNRPTDKLTPPWRGPMKVVAANDWKYTLLNLSTGSTSDFHVSDLKAYDDSQTENPTAVASRDQREFVIEEIVSHTGTPRRKTAMKFLVKWKNYDETFNTWEPWANVQKSEALQKYSDGHKLNL